MSNATETARPTRAQRFFASRWFLRIWFTTFSLGTLVVVFFNLSDDFTAYALRDWQTWGWLLLVTAISASVGCLLGIFPGIFIIGPFLYSRTCLNGAPFHVGDRVQIIGGSYDGTITSIYAGWQGDSVRLDLGEEAKNTNKDVFSPLCFFRV